MFYIIIDKFGMPLLRLLDPEQAHDIAIWAASNGLLPRVSHFCCVYVIVCFDVSLLLTTTACMYAHTE